MNKRTLTAGVAAAAVLIPASSASAFYCANASKKDGAGVITAEPTVNNGGNFVAKGAFVDVGGGTEIMVRGGDHHDAGGKDNPFRSFGAATEKAITNGPADRGIVEAE